MDILRLSQDDAELLRSTVRQLLGSDPGPDQRHLTTALGRSDCYFLVAREEESPIGFLSAFRFPSVEEASDLVYLYDLVVAPVYRRRGIATQLIETLVANCRDHGVVSIWAGTAVENLAARGAFEKTGARRVSETYAEYVYALRS